MALRHHGQHPAEDCGPCRWKTVSLGAGTTPTRTECRTFQPSEPTRYNAWERGIVTEKRPGGFEIPVVNAKGHPIGVKHYADYRRKFDEARARVRQDPSALTGGK